MTKIALVLGNGFDLDLGLKTRYADFANRENPEWNDFLNMSGTIIKDCFRTEFVDHLYLAREKECWFDIEEEIYKFTIFHDNLNEEQIGLIREQYTALVLYLCRYLKRVTNPSNVKTDALAMDLLLKINASNNNAVIYTYNYTDCFELCQCERTEKVKMSHIHGALNTNNIILGCRVYDKNKRNVRLDFLYKEDLSLLKDIIYQNLTTADEVIFYGHSLNRMDFCYFKDFFKTLEDTECSCSYMTIICKDSYSEEQIKQNWGRNVNLSALTKHIDIKFLHTDLWYTKDASMLNIYSNLLHRIINKKRGMQSI